MRRGLLIGLSALLLIGGGVTAYWYVVGQRLADGFAAWAASRRAAGWSVSAGPSHLAGWPLAAVLVVPDFRIAGGEPDIPGGLSWGADRVNVGIDLLHPQAINVIPTGIQHIGPANRPGWPFRAGDMRMRLPLQQDRPPGVAEIAARELRAGTGGLSVGTIDAHVAFDTGAGKDQSAVAVALTARGIRLPGGVNWPLGPHIATLILDGALDGALPPPRDLTADAAAWRDGGGALAVRRLELHWGPLDGWLTASGTLDAALQPNAVGQVTVTNYAPTLDALAAHRVIGNDAALAAKAVLSLLAAVPAAGGSPQVEVPFAIRDRTVSVRGIPLVKLPELHWPQ